MQVGEGDGVWEAGDEGARTANCGFEKTVGCVRVRGGPLEGRCEVYCVCGIL